MAYQTYYKYPVNQDLLEKAREEIFEKVSIPQYIYDNVDSTVDLRTERKMCCPLHQEDTPSFIYNEDRNIWTCYGTCHRSGKVIDLHKLLFGIKNYPSAVMHFRQMYGSKYNLQFKDFFIYEGNVEMRVEDVIGLERKKPDISKFLKKDDKSPTFLISQITKELEILKLYDKSTYFRYCIRFDAMFNYQEANVVNLTDFIKELKNKVAEAKKPK